MDSNPISDLVISGLDQTLPMTKQQKDLFDKVDTVVQEAIRDNKPEIATDAIKYMLGISRITGLALAKLIYILKYQWKNFNRREEFESFILDATGISKTTYKRYYRVWEMFVSGDIPGDVLPKMQLQPIRCLVPISTLWFTERDNVTAHQWDKLSNAPDPATVNALIREIRGVAPKDTSIQIELQEDGTLLAWHKNKPYNLGYLNIEDTDEIVQRAISRLVGDGRVLEK